MSHCAAAMPDRPPEMSSAMEVTSFAFRKAMATVAPSAVATALTEHQDAKNVAVGVERSAGPGVDQCVPTASGSSPRQMVWETTISAMGSAKAATDTALRIGTERRFMDGAGRSRQR
ncbi:hypothetical protein PlfCFBP13513_07370 [Plantibacter flavus]|nr:hypothetical protein PlfCFBP13513_07370 [Plantibacter flavus]